jgi:DNA mismatch endonuclease (patch repair protein)
MADIFTKEKRSWVMSRIRGNNTKIDLKMKGLLDALGWDYKMYPKMYGNPDFILEKEKIAIFCDGDFWHGYNYRRKIPRQKFWKDKIERNMARDKKITRKLREEGWSVLRFWEHDIEKRMDVCINKLIGKIMEKYNPPN